MPVQMPRWVERYVCCGACSTRQAVMTMAIYTLTYAVAGLILCIIYRIFFFERFEPDVQHLLRVALGITAAWSSLQLLVSVLCLVGVLIDERRLLVPFTIVKFLSCLLYFGSSVTVTVKADTGEVMAASMVIGAFFSCIEWLCWKFLMNNMSEIDTRTYTRQPWIMVKEGALRKEHERTPLLIKDSSRKR